MQEQIIGKSIWENYIHPNNIILTQQMQQNKDIKYATLLQNLHNGIISNLDLLKTHFFTNKNVNLFDDLWKTITSIVLRNELRNAINQQMININSI
jgi:hypothetical protein